MDDIVIKGMAKWPNVPAVYGWLELDRRGAWLLKGAKISNAAVTGFIGRNYEHDGFGRWFFQNGPQRVYVTLHYTPLVYRVTAAPDGPLELEAQNGRRTSTGSSAWIDEQGTVLVVTDLGVGIVHDKDLNSILNALVDADGKPLGEEQLDAYLRRLQEEDDVGLYLRGLERPLPVRAIHSRNVAEKFGFDARPSDEAARADTTRASG